MFFIYLLHRQIIPIKYTVIVDFRRKTEYAMDVIQNVLKKYIFELDNLCINFSMSRRERL